MKQFETALQAKVASRNLVHQTITSLIPASLEALRPFVGQKVLNQGDVKSKKLTDALPKFSNTPALQVWYRSTGYNLVLEVRVCVVYRNRYGEMSSACYAEASAYIGNIEKQVLTSLNEEHKFRTDYTEAEVVQARKDVLEAERALRDAESRLSYFGKHDNH